MACYISVCTLLVTILAVQTYASIPVDVVQLWDDDFEHRTQASTGQTTGTWVVLLTASDIRNSERYDAVFDELAADEEKQVIYAKVDMEKNKALATRFHSILVPAVVVFAHRKMHVYEGSLESPQVVVQLRAWAQEGGFEQGISMDVPSHFKRKTMEEIEEENNPEGKAVNWQKIYLGVGCIIAAVIFRTYVQLEKRKDADANAQKLAEVQGSGATATDGPACGAGQGQAAAAGGSPLAKRVNRKKV